MAKSFNIKELQGKKFNLLTLVNEVLPHKTISGNIRRKANFLCDCGNYKEIQISAVINLSTKSCGCHSKKTASNKMKKLNLVHGFYNTTEYNAWVAMKKRCLNKNNKHFKDYGGRGITVSEKWKNSFQNFINDMGLKKCKNYSLERIDNNKGYCKENCIWTDKKTQQRNKRNNVKITAFGQIKTLSEWAEILKFSWHKLYYRIYLSKNNYSLEEMLKKNNYDGN